jgi:hypothetical protein
VLVATLLFVAAGLSLKGATAGVEFVGSDELIACLGANPFRECGGKEQSCEEHREHIHGAGTCPQCSGPGSVGNDCCRCPETDNCWYAKCYWSSWGWCSQDIGDTCQCGGYHQTGQCNGDGICVITGQTAVTVENSCGVIFGTCAGQ